MKMTAFAHIWWKRFIKPGDLIIDATCGNGCDTVTLARLLQGKGALVAYDLQESAIERTRALIQKELSELENQIISLRCSSHENFQEKAAHLIVYNLGYLPQGNKEITTQKETTLKSLSNACQILLPSGWISMMLYPGHLEGKQEEQAILNFASALDPKQWTVMHHRCLNRLLAPSLLLIQKS